MAKKPQEQQEREADRQTEQEVMTNADKRSSEKTGRQHEGR